MIKKSIKKEYKTIDGGAWHVVRNDFDRNVKSQTLKCQNVK